MAIQPGQNQRLIAPPPSDPPRSTSVGGSDQEPERNTQGGAGKPGPDIMLLEANRQILDRILKVLARMEKVQGEDRKSRGKSETLAIKTADFQKRTMQEAIDSGQVFKDLRREQRIESLEKKAGKGADGGNLVETFKKGFTSFLDRGNEAIYHPGKTVDRILTGAMGLVAKPFQAFADARKSGAERKAAEEQARLNADYQKQLDAINESREQAHQDRAFAFYDELLTRHFGNQGGFAPSGEDKPIRSEEDPADDTAASFMGSFQNQAQLLLPPPPDLVPAGGPSGPGSLFGDAGMSPADFFLYLFDEYFSGMRDFFITPDSSAFGRFLSGISKTSDGFDEDDGKGEKGAKYGLDAATLAVIGAAILGLVTILTALAPGLNAIGVGIGTLISTIAPAIGAILQAIADILGGLAPIIIDLLGTLVDLIKELIPYVMQIVDAVVKLVTMILDIIGKILQDLFYLIEKLLTKITDILTSVVNLIKEVLSGAGRLVTGVVDTVQGGLDIVNAVTTGIKNVIGTVLDNIVKILEQIFTFFSTIMRTVFDAIIVGINLMVAALLAALSAILSAITYLITWVSTGGDWKLANAKAEQAKGRLFNYIVSKSGAQAEALAVFDGDSVAAGGAVLTLRDVDELRARGEVLGNGTKDAGVNRDAKTDLIKQRTRQYMENSDAGLISPTTNNITNVYNSAMPANAQRKP